MTGEFDKQVFEVVARIPEGKVATYGQIAAMIGAPRSARFIGFALRRNPVPVTMPCHRVVFADGRICEGYVFGGPDVQRTLLREEGVVFVDEMHVDLDTCRWEGDCC